MRVGNNKSMQTELSPVVDFTQLSDLDNLSVLLSEDDLIFEVGIKSLFHIEGEVID